MTLFVPDPKKVDSSLAGCYVASPVRFMLYGRGSVKNQLNDIISKLGVSRAIIITGKSLSTKTPVIKDIETTLKDSHAGTFSKIRQHSPIQDIREATQLVVETKANVLISVGGGSPIDAAKAVAYNIHKTIGVWMPSIAIPTTLSVAETTQNAGFTTEEGHKIAVTHPELVPKAVRYDGDLALYTPIELWTSTGMRAMDHAIELLYHPLASEVPTKRLALEAARDLFTFLPKTKGNPQNANVRQQLLLASYCSLFPFLYSGGVGLSHSIGHAIGSTYGIPHGITSCISLAAVLRYKAITLPEGAAQIARLVPYLGKQSTGDASADALMVSEEVGKLVKYLGHKSTLSENNVSPGEEEAITTRALGGGREKHPQFDTVLEIVKSLY